MASLGYARVNLPPNTCMCSTALVWDNEICIAAVTAAVAAYRWRKYIIKNTNQFALAVLLLDEEDAVVSREHICSLCDVVSCTALASSLHIRSCLKPLAQRCLHDMLRPVRCILCGRASPTRSKATLCAMPRLKVGAQGNELLSAVVRGMLWIAARFKTQMVYTLDRILANRENCRECVQTPNILGV